MEAIAQILRSIALALGGGTGITGQIIAYGGASAPVGFLACDGTAISRTTYVALYAVLGTSYGVGDGSTTFNLPDLRGRVAVGKNAVTFSALGATGGEETHLLTTAEMPSHQHTQLIGGGLTTVNPTAGIGIIGQSNTSLTAAAGGGGAHNNIQPYQVVNYMVKF